MLLPDEVDDREPRLVLAEAQPASDLLREHGCRLRRAQEDDSVDIRDVDAFAEHVDAEDAAKLPEAQALQRLPAIWVGGFAGDGLGLQAVF